MGFSKFEFRPVGTFRYIEGYLVWRVQKEQAGGHSVRLLEPRACKFGCCVRTFIFSATFQLQMVCTNRSVQSLAFVTSAVVTHINFYIFHLIIRILNKIRLLFCKGHCNLTNKIKENTELQVLVHQQS